MATLNSKKIVEEYLNKSDWRVSENSNSPYSFGGLNKHIIAEVSKDYWLRYVYPENIAESYVSGDMHIHDLGGLTLYCCGFSLKKILEIGVKGVPNIPRSKPAKHFGAVLNQIANLTTVYQNEIMGAVAFNSFDTLLAPFIKRDGLSYEQVKQEMQNFIYSINSNSRGGAEPAFSNLTFDITPPDDLLNDPIFVAGDYNLDITYKDCQPEIDMINKAFYELMLEGDADGRPFAYPIPTYNVHKRFDWENEKSNPIFEMAGKYGYPYFANFLNSDMDPSDARSMCCRLRLDLSELKKRNGGLFGSGDSTGSIGVVTINLPRLAFKHQNDSDGFLRALDDILNLAKDSLEIKRKWLTEQILNKKLIPAFIEYVNTMDNHFSTIGVVGMNEMCENFFYGQGKDILSDEGHALSLEVGRRVREKLVQFQQETGHLYNFEATPAESTAYSLAIKDVKKFKGIAYRGTKEAPYYTNSCHIPVSKIQGLKETFDHQEDLQIMFTGGTVIHIFLNGAIGWEKAKHVIKTICTIYRVPYVSLSPLNRYCDNHGYTSDSVTECPICGAPLDLYQRITGYLRNTKYFNPGKKSEFAERVQLKL